MKQIVYLTVFLLLQMNGCAQIAQQATKSDDGYRPLTAEEKQVILNKGTERAFTGEYDKFYEEGTYVCKRCGAELYNSTDKFDSGCGWPSFDDEIESAVRRTLDADGVRTEITCVNCNAHLGHVFLGEGFTDKDTRHCVNSISLLFVPAAPDKDAETETGYFAGGCFWGVEYYMEQLPGVLNVESGYMGGIKPNPTYQEVSSKKTGYAEVVKVVYNPLETNYETVAKMFFEIHDPTQVNRQGPDIGEQYRSEIFYTNMEQKRTAEKLIKILEEKGYNVATKVTPAEIFWEAEDYHQDYYVNKGGEPYCHAYTQRF